MPSIRIKGQVYSTLEDAISNNDDALWLRGEPVPGVSPRNALLPYSNTPNVQRRPSLPLLPRGLLDVPSSPLHRRPRSTSRVHEHCINTSRNSQHSPQISPSPLSNTKSTPASNSVNARISQEMITIEGTLTDLRVPSHVDPGIVENSLNNSLITDDEHSQFSGHHHDEVVEHLDVIGIFPSFSASYFKITFCCRSASWCRF